MGGIYRTPLQGPPPEIPKKKKSPENTFIRSPLPGDFPALFWPRILIFDDFDSAGAFRWGVSSFMSFSLSLFLFTMTISPIPTYYQPMSIQIS